MKSITFSKGSYVVAIFTMLSIMFGSVQSANAQTFGSAVEYMNYMSAEYEKITSDSWDYIRSVNHGKSARKVEKTRSEMIKTVETAKKKISKMPAYDGSTTYRDSVVQFLTINYKVLNHDYAEIVDMEEIAEQSYDAMEAYLLAQENANKRLGEASDMVKREQDRFAKDNNINLVEGKKNKTADKLAEAGKVMEYYNVVYLIFFKAYKQEAYLIEALGKNDIGAIQQNKNTLVKYAKEGLGKLDKHGKYKDDYTIITECKKILNFYISEGNKKVPILVDFNIKKENFEKIKKAFDAKKQSDRSQEDVDTFNKAVNDMNGAGNTYNQTNAELNKDRAERINSWNKSTGAFLDKHTAH